MFPPWGLDIPLAPFIRGMKRRNPCNPWCIQQPTMSKIQSEIQSICKELPDFTFIYLGETDERGGHDHGWMSPEYMAALRKAWTCIEKIFNSLPEDYTLIVVADHGGHDRSHGSTDPQDMTIPVVIHGPRFTAGAELADVSIKDISVTIAKLLEVPCAPEWEGKALI